MTFSPYESSSPRLIYFSCVILFLRQTRFDNQEKAAGSLSARQIFAQVKRFHSSDCWEGRWLKRNKAVSAGWDGWVEGRWWGSRGGGGPHMEAFEQSGLGLLWLLYTLQPLQHLVNTMRSRDSRLVIIGSGDDVAQPPGRKFTEVGVSEEEGGSGGSGRGV